MNENSVFPTWIFPNRFSTTSCTAKIVSQIFTLEPVDWERVFQFKYKFSQILCGKTAHMLNSKPKIHELCGITRTLLLWNSVMEMHENYVCENIE